MNFSYGEKFKGFLFSNSESSKEKDKVILSKYVYKPGPKKVRDIKRARWTSNPLGMWERYLYL